MDKSKAISAGVQLASGAGMRFNFPMRTMKSLNKNSANPLKIDMPTVWPVLNMRPDLIQCAVAGVPSAPRGHAEDGGTHEERPSLDGRCAVLLLCPS